MTAVRFSICLILGTSSIAFGSHAGQVRTSNRQHVGHSKNDLIGRWVIDVKLSGAIPAAALSDAKEMALHSYIEFLPGGRYKESMAGVDFSGRFKISGSTVKLVASGWSAGEPEVGKYRAKEGTITFSPGPHRVVYVRESKAGARPNG